MKLRPYTGNRATSQPEITGGDRSSGASDLSGRFLVTMKLTTPPGLVIAARRELLVDAIDHAKHCIAEGLYDMAIRALEVAERQAEFWPQDAVSANANVAESRP